MNSTRNQTSLEKTELPLQPCGDHNPLFFALMLSVLNNMFVPSLTFHLFKLILFEIYMEHVCRNSSVIQNMWCIRNSLLTLSGL